MLSQVESEVHHYQVLNEVTYQKKDDSDISKVDDFYQVKYWEPTREEDNSWMENLSGTEEQLS